MPRQTFNKLVRDNIPNIIEQDNRAYATRILSDAEYEEALRVKVQEEAREVAAASPDELTKELADLLEVTQALMALHDITMDDVIAKQAERKDSRGAFDSRIMLLWADVE